MQSNLVEARPRHERLVIPRNVRLDICRATGSNLKELTTQTKEEMQAKLTGLLTEKLATARDAGTKITLLLAGGSALSAYDDLDPQLLKDLGSNLSIALGDDRFTQPYDSSLNNMEQLMRNPDTGELRTFFKHAQEAGCDIFYSQQQFGDTLESYATRYRNAIDRMTGPDHAVVVILGMGGTKNFAGHIAGIAPELQNTQEAYYQLFGPAGSVRSVEGYDSEGKIDPPMRVTITPSFFQHLDSEKDTVILMTSGDEKADAVRKTFDEMGTTQEIPGRLIHLIRTPIHVLLDLQEIDEGDQTEYHGAAAKIVELTPFAASAKETVGARR